MNLKKKIMHARKDYIYVVTQSKERDFTTVVCGLPK